jgi:ABC-type Fe3+/spermidine/putrescine transport system ATPase subunit
MREEIMDEVREEIRKLKDAWYQERTKMDQVISDRDQENEDLRKRRRKVKNWDNLNHVSDEDLYNNNPNDETASFISDADSLQRLKKDQSNNIKENVKKHGVTIEITINEYKVYDRYERQSMFEPIPIRESKSYLSYRMLDRDEFKTKFFERQL